jgi:hypothetical protein
LHRLTPDVGDRFVVDTSLGLGCHRRRDAGPRQSCCGTVLQRRGPNTEPLPPGTTHCRARTVVCTPPSVMRILGRRGKTAAAAGRLMRALRVADESAAQTTRGLVVALS